MLCYIPVSFHLSLKPSSCLYLQELIPNRVLEGHRNRRTPTLWVRNIMLTQLILYILFTCWLIAGFHLPSQPRPDVARIHESRNRSRSADENGNGTGKRHISAKLQPQILYHSVNASDNDSSRVVPGWQREGLFGFGVGTVYMLDRPSSLNLIVSSTPRPVNPPFLPPILIP